MTYRSWLLDWVDVYKKPNLKPKSFENLTMNIRLHIPDWFKDKQLSEMNSFDIQKALNTVPSSRVRADIYDIYGATFRRAHLLGMISNNPMISVDKVKHVRKVGKALSKRELGQFLAVINTSRYRLLFLCYLYTGARRNEILTLRWSDIDFDNNRITLNGSKTERYHTSPLRTIPLFPELRDIFNTMQKGKGEYVFPYRGDCVTKRFKKLCPAHKLHDLQEPCRPCGRA